VRSLRATSAAVHVLYLGGKGREGQRVVMKRFVRREWLAKEPDVPAREYAALEILLDSNVPAPEPIAADLAPERCDVPTVLMTHVSARSRFSPSGAARTLPQLARLLVRIHAVPHRNHPALPPHRRWYADQPRVAPTWSRYPDAWLTALELAAQPGPPAASCFIHRDFNPGNVLWRGGEPVAVVDWANACIGPREVDVAHMRNNLAGLGGMALADRFLRAWLSLAEVDRYDPHWDIVSATESLPDVPPEAPTAQLAALDEFLVAALRRLAPTMRPRAGPIVIAPQGSDP
jgi:aminoglycoside phosphotransferase (APT) family kinase protein